MPTLSPCPDRGELERYLLGHGSAEGTADLESHLSTCPECAAAAGGLAGADDLVNAVRQAGSTPDTPEPASVESLVSAFRMASRQSVGKTVSFAPGVAGTSDPAAIPARIGGYEVRGVLGAGGMGVVYHAYDPVLRREVAVKVVKRQWHRSPAALGRFLAEARSVAAVEHDNIVVIHAVETHDGLPCLVMPLLKGDTLAARLKGRQPLPLPHVLRVAADVLNGLAAAHAVGLIHRDIKPSNLWVEPSGRVKVLDFGLAVSGDDTTAGQGGTPGYMAPEQIHGGPIDARADLFAVGGVLYRAATGRDAFEGISPADCLVKTITRDPRPVRELNKAVPARLATIIDRLLSKQPADRPQSAEGTLAELHAIEADATARRRRFTRRAWLVGVAAAAVAGGFGAWMLTPGKSPEEPPVEVEFTHDPDVTKLVLSRDGVEQVVELPKQAKLSLAPGEYSVRLAAEVPNRKLEPAAILVLPGTPAKVAVSLPGELAVSKMHDAGVTGVVAVAEKGKGLVVVSAGLDQTLNRWTIGVKGGQPIAQLTSPARAFAATPDGVLVVTAGGNKSLPAELGVQLWDGRTLTKQGEPLTGHTGLVSAVAISADGSRVVSAGTGEVWLRTRTLQRREQLVGHGDAKVLAAALDDAGKLALTGDDAGDFAVWDTATTKLVLKRTTGVNGAAAKPVRAVGFTPTAFVSAGDDGIVRLWDRTTGEVRELVAKPDAKPVHCLAVSADGTRLLCGGADGTVRLWSLASGKQLAALTGHQGTVNAVAFTPDGLGAVSGGSDRTVRVWRLPLP